jgi:hypothetical protein
MRKPLLSRIVMLLAAVVMVLAVSQAQAAPLVAPPLLSAPVTLAWSPAVDPSVRGYAVYYGPTNQPTTDRADAGTNLTLTLFNLKANVGYRFYAVSYDALGTTSVPSNELLLTPPPISSLKIARQSDGSMSLNCQAAPGTLCSVLFTPTLQPAAWRMLAQVTSDQVGNVIARDMSARQVMSRFYRVALGAQPVLGTMQIKRQADGNMLLSGQAPPGVSCRVLYAATPNATSWQTLRSVVADAEGNAVALDTTAGQAPRRFYRMVTP